MINHVAHYDLTMKRKPKARILTGPLTTPVFGQDGIFPGLRIQLRQDTTETVRHDNALQAVGPFGSPSKTSVYLHGPASLPEFDGYASDVTAFIAPGVVAPSSDPNLKGRRWMSHCHNVPHEDQDMMAHFGVGTIAARDPHHPIEAALPEPEPV